MNLLGLIGNPVSHSKSPLIFDQFFKNDDLDNWEYKLFPLPSIQQISNLVKEHENLVGFNVTTPFKEEIIQYLDSVSQEAKFIGAVNTVLVKEGKLSGYNTDSIGFIRSLDHNSINPNNSLILGTGGASKAVEHGLNKLGGNINFVSRGNLDKGIRYSDLSSKVLSQFDTIINATPVGMHPSEELFPDIPYQSLNKNQVVIDLIYNPAKSRFLIKAENIGCKILNGSDMLQFQAEEAWRLFKESALNT